MILIAEDQLQRVGSRRQLDQGLGLPLAKVNMAVIRRDRGIYGRELRVHEKVVVAGVGVGHTGRRYAHPGETEANRDRALDPLSIVGR
jgi:hypothetical protein